MVMFIRTSSKDVINFVLFYKKNPRNKSSQWSLIRRCIILVFLFGFFMFFYLITNCRSTIFTGVLTYNHHYLLETTNHQHVNSVKTRKKIYPTYCSIHGLLPSLMVKPLKSVLQSTIQGLTVKKLENLFRIANHSMAKENLLNCSERHFWNGHQESYMKRRNRLNYICQRYGFLDRIFTTWHLSTNRQFMSKRNHHYHHRNNNQTSGHKTLVDNYKFCNTRNCPLLVNADHHLLTCFVQKIASTSVKHMYLYLANQNLSEKNIDKLVEPVNNVTKFHFKVNNELYRISPTYLAYSKEANYYKTIFVRHPFVRVVSAFKDKAERNPEEETYFYDKYWNPLLDRLHGKKRDPNLRVTFREFVEELLLITDPYQYDEHWAPIWTRCEPCFIHYDFIGKLETGEEDFRNFKSRANKNLINITIWENINYQFDVIVSSNNKRTIKINNMDINNINNQTNMTIIKEKTLKNCQRQRLKYAETIHYLSQLSPKSLIELYKRYYLDFELFGYSIQELFQIIAQ